MALPFFTNHIKYTCKYTFSHSWYLTLCGPTEFKSVPAYVLSRIKVKYTSCNVMNQTGYWLEYMCCVILWIRSGPHVGNHDFIP